LLLLPSSPSPSPFPCPILFSPLDPSSRPFLSTLILPVTADEGDRLPSHHQAETKTRLSISHLLSRHHPHIGILLGRLCRWASTKQLPSRLSCLWTRQTACIEAFAVWQSRPNQADPSDIETNNRAQNLGRSTISHQTDYRDCRASEAGGLFFFFVFFAPGRFFFFFCWTPRPAPHSVGVSENGRQPGNLGSWGGENPQRSSTTTKRTSSTTGTTTAKS
jgi:hypothetical protein